MAVPLKTENLRSLHNGNAAMPSRNGRKSDSRMQRFSNTWDQAKVLTEFLAEDADEEGIGLAKKPWHTRPSMRSTSMAGRALDLKPSSLHA